MRVYPSSKFSRNFKKLPRDIQERVIERDAIFRANPRDARLDVHKLHGDKKGEWAYSVDNSYRVTFVVVSSDAVLYTNIGTHDEIYR